MGKKAGAWPGRAVVLPEDLGLHPIDIKEPGPWRAKGARERAKQLHKNKQIKMSDQNLVLANERTVGVLGLSGSSQGRLTLSASSAFPGSWRAGLPVFSLSGQNVGPEVGGESPGLVPS